MVFLLYSWGRNTAIPLSTPAGLGPWTMISCGIPFYPVLGGISLAFRISSCKFRKCTNILSIMPIVRNPSSLCFKGFLAVAIIFVYPKCLSSRQYFSTTPLLWTQWWNMTQIRWPYGCVGSLCGKSFGAGGEVFNDIWNLCSHWLVGVGRGRRCKCLSLVYLWAGCPGV